MRVCVCRREKNQPKTFGRREKKTTAAKCIRIGTYTHIYIYYQSENKKKVILLIKYIPLPIDLKRTIANQHAD